LHKIPDFEKRRGMQTRRSHKHIVALMIGVLAAALWLAWSLVWLPRREDSGTDRPTPLLPGGE
jgi:hypothetical protein